MPQQKKKKYYWIVGVLLGVGVVVHALPFFLYSPHPLGYDTGFYRYYLIEPVRSFPNTPSPGLGNTAVLPRIFLDLWRFAGVPADVALYASYILLHAAGALALFIFLRGVLGEKPAFIALFLFIISPVQYTAYWFMFWKQAFALPLLLLTFFSLEKRSLAALPLGLAVLFSHHTTAVILMGTLFIYMCINRERLRELLIIFTPLILLFFTLYGKSYTPAAELPIGVFMEYREYILLSLPLLFVIPWSTKTIVQENRHSVFIAFSCLAILFPLLSLPFYQRIFVFTDIALIGLAAAGGWRLFSFAHMRPVATRTALYGFIALMLGWQLANLSTNVTRLTPLIGESIRNDLAHINDFVPPDGAIVTSIPLAPWVHGWTEALVIAPGLLGNTQNSQVWTNFDISTHAEEKKAFLRNFRRPLFFFLEPREQKTLATVQECLEQKTQFLLQYHCD